MSNLHRRRWFISSKRGKNKDAGLYLGSASLKMGVFEDDYSARTMEGSIFRREEMTLA